MNASLSFLSFNSASNAGDPNGVAPAAGKSSPEAPFSGMLDRAVRETPGRKSKPTQSERPTAKEARPTSTDKADKADQRENKLPTEPPQPRVKDNDRDRDELANLAGACGVVAPVAPPPESTAPVEADGEVALFAPVNGQDASSENTQVSNATPGTTTAETSADGGLDLATLVAPAELAATENNSLEDALAPTTAQKEAAVTPSSIETQLSVNTEGLDPTTANPAIPELNAASLNQLATSPNGNSAVLSAATIESTEAEVSPVANDEVAAVATSESEEADSAPEEVRRSVRAVRRARLDALETATGIGGAKSSETMKTVIKKEELAGGTEQFLPVSSPNALSALRNLPGELNRKAGGQLSAADGVDAAAKAASSATNGAVSTESDTLFVKPNNPMARVSEVISREIRMFKRGGDDLVEVVLTPDTKTQISLRLQWREGQVEVQARCDLGDYQSLNTQWSQLQASLAHHGVRLSHLSERASTGFTEFFNNPGFAQHQGRDEQAQNPADQMESLPTLPVSVVKPGPTPAVRRSNRIFDSWA